MKLKHNCFKFRWADSLMSSGRAFQATDQRTRWLNLSLPALLRGSRLFATSFCSRHWRRVLSLLGPRRFQRWTRGRLFGCGFGLAVTSRQQTRTQFRTTVAAVCHQLQRVDGCQRSGQYACNRNWHEYSQSFTKMERRRLHLIHPTLNTAERKSLRPRGNSLWVLHNVVYFLGSSFSLSILQMHRLIQNVTRTSTRTAPIFQ